MSLFQDLKLKRRKVDSRCSSDGESVADTSTSSPDLVTPLSPKMCDQPPTPTQMTSGECCIEKRAFIFPQCKRLVFIGNLSFLFIFRPQGLIRQRSRERIPVQVSMGTGVVMTRTTIVTIITRQEEAGVGEGEEVNATIRLQWRRERSCRRHCPKTWAAIIITATTTTPQTRMATTVWTGTNGTAKNMAQVGHMRRTKIPIT